MKKILIDATTLSDQYKNRGIGTYSQNILEGLIQNKNIEWHLIGFEDIEQQFNNANFHSLGEVRFSTPKNVLFFRSRYLPLIKRINPDLYFAPHLERGLPIGICKTAVMIHDVYPLIANSFSPKGFIFNYLKGVFYKYNLNRAKQADVILTNSSFTKDEIIKSGFDKGKIHVSHLALSEEFNVSILKKKIDRKAVLKKYKILKPYFLYYGGLEPNKNVDVLLAAFSKIIKDKGLKLVIVDKTLYFQNGEICAGSNLASKIQLLIRELNLLQQVILPRFIEWEDFPVIQAESEAFIHLSEYEGFGLSVLEGISSGTAVIAANRSCYPEVLGDGALFVDPDDTVDISEAMVKILQDRSCRDKIVQKGLQQAAKYSWERTVELTFNAFSKVL